MIYLAIFLCFLLLLLDALSLRRVKPLLLSPMVMFVASVGFVYIGPLAVANLSYSEASELKPEEMRLVTVAVVLFLMTFLATYTILIGSIDSCVQRTGRKIVPQKNFLLSKRQLGRLMIISIVVFVVYLGVGVGFNPISMVRRVIAPRQYTQLREGTGYISYVRAITFYALISTVAARTILAKDRWSLRLIYVGITAVVAVGGGSKSSLVYLLIGFVLANQLKYRQQRFSFLSVRRLLSHAGAQLMLLALASLTLMGSFKIMDFGSSGDQFEQSFSHRIVEYSKEAANTGRVMNDFEGDPSRIVSVLVDTATFVIPRFLYPDKPITGMYNMYWKPAYESNRASYHASTYGALSEAHMLFDFAGPFVYGVIFATLIVEMTKRFYSMNSPFEFSILFFFYGFMYFFVRAGFSGSVAVMVIILIAGNWMLFKILRVKSQRLPRREIEA